MDAKQAILLSGSATKADAEAQLAARSREVEHKLVARVEGEHACHMCMAYSMEELHACDD